MTTLLAPGPGQQPGGGQMRYAFFAGAEQAACYELNAVWGLTIALCVLFAISAVATGFLFLGQRRAGGGGPASDSDSQVEMVLPPAKDFSDGASFAGSGAYIPPPPPMMSRPDSPAGASFRGGVSDQLHFRPE